MTSNSFCHSKEVSMQTYVQHKLASLIFFVILIFVPLTASAQEVSLVNLLVQQLGVTTPQAEGGAGAIFSVAKDKLTPSEFGQVSASVPDMNQLLEAAPQPPSEGLGGMLSGGSSLLGGGNQSLDGIASLASSFSQLGLSPDMVGKFTQVVQTYLQSSGGDTVSNLLMAALQ
jgi:hypothetical protein